MSSVNCPGSSAFASNDSNFTLLNVNWIFCAVEEFGTFAPVKVRTNFRVVELMKSS